MTAFPGDRAHPVATLLYALGPNYTGNFSESLSHFQTYDLISAQNAHLFHRHPELLDHLSHFSLAAFAAHIVFFYGVRDNGAQQLWCPRRMWTARHRASDMELGHLYPTPPHPQPAHPPLYSLPHPPNPPLVSRFPLAFVPPSPVVVHGADASDASTLAGMSMIGLALTESNGDLIGGVSACNRRSIKEAIADIGGLGVMLYLFARSPVRPSPTPTHTPHPLVPVCPGPATHRRV